MQRQVVFLGILGLALFSFFGTRVSQVAAEPPDRVINLERIGSTPFIGSTGTEIAVFDPESKRLFSTNVLTSSIDIFDLSKPAAPALVTSVALGGTPNSVATKDGVFAVAIENTTKTVSGRVVFFNPNGALLSSLTVGAQPDMVTFTHNGRRLLVANEGEPDATYTIDPEGSVSIIDMTAGAANLTQSDVKTATFTSFTSGTLDPRIRIFGPNATIPTNIEPEYITVSQDSKTAWVTLQENNALGILDIEAGVFTELVALGFKNHNAAANAFDPSDRDNEAETAGAIVIGNWPVFGMYQPDGIDAYRVRGETYLVTANEGDVRDWPGYSEISRVGSLTLDSGVFSNIPGLQMNRNLGRLNVSTANGNLDADAQFEQLYSFGGRSFSIWNAAGQLVFDSGDDFERITAAQTPAIFNSNGAPATFDTRSDDKGSEPEGVVLGKVFGRTFAFICLERTGGIIIYDVSDPHEPRFVRYVNTGTAGDISPEAPSFVKAEDSPNGNALLIVPHEVSGNVTIFQITR